MPTGPFDDTTDLSVIRLDSFESSHLLGHPDALRQQLAKEGFLFFRDLLPDDVLGEVRVAILEVIAEEGWLADATDPQDRRPGPLVVREADDRWFPAYRRIQALECFHRLAHHDRLLALAGDLLGGPLLVHPRKIARLTFPTSEFPTPPHQDFPLIQGTPEVLTAWLALAPCSLRDGALRVLRRSQRDGLRPRQQAPGVGGVGVTVRLAEQESWVSTDYRPGDVLIFHSLTVHWAPPNRGERLRLSADFRYQLASDPVVEGSLLPHYWPTVPGWEVLTECWSTTRWVDSPANPALSQLSAPLGPLELGPVRLVDSGPWQGED